MICIQCGVTARKTKSGLCRSCIEREAALPACGQQAAEEAPETPLTRDNLQQRADDARDASSELVNALKADESYPGLSEEQRTRCHARAIVARHSLTQIVKDLATKEGGPHSNGKWSVDTSKIAGKTMYFAICEFHQRHCIACKSYDAAVRLVDHLAELAS